MSNILLLLLLGSTAHVGPWPPVGSITINVLRSGVVSPHLGGARGFFNQGFLPLAFEEPTSYITRQ
jgi:hypothetical protein